jgi:excinuclease ABC subunit C
MVGPDDRVLYVGKSVRVRTRLLSYFRERRGAKGEELLRHTHRIEWEYVSSEFGALLLEMKSIKRWRPPYNVVHKRDGVYAFVKVTRELAPRLQAVSRVLPDGARYFGPFAGPDRIRTAVREISDVLELRDCARNTPVRYADQLDLFFIEERAPMCLRGDLGRCLAPCAARCTRSEYHERAELALRFLRGEADVPVMLLRQRMEQAATRLNFEHAALLRDRIERLELLREELTLSRDTIETLTFLYSVPGESGEDRFYVIRRGLVLAEMAAPRTPAERNAVVGRARRLIQESARGMCGVGAAEASEILMIARWFRRRPSELERVWRPDDPELDIEIAV